VPLLGSGTAHVSYFSVDRAGNHEGANTSTIQWDNIAPTVSHSITPVPNASGWDNSDTTVTFSATDDFSGVASLSPPVLVTDETPGLDVPGFAYDVAGNKGTDTAHVQLDKTAPTIDASRAPAANAFGWNNEDVTVSFECADPISGVAVCPDPVTFTQEGADQSATRSAKDHADNSASATLGNISIDRTKPELSGAPTSSPNGNGWYRRPLGRRCDVLQRRRRRSDALRWRLRLRRPRQPHAPLLECRPRRQRRGQEQQATEDRRPPPDGRRRDLPGADEVRLEQDARHGSVHVLRRRVRSGGLRP
jgi:hypothetical protein